MFQFANAVPGSLRFRQTLLPLLMLAASIQLLHAKAPPPPSVVFHGAASNTPNIVPSSPNGIAIDPAGDVYLAFGENGLVKIAAGTGVQTTITAKGLSTPAGIALDKAGNLFIADPHNNRVVELPAGGGKQKTVGSGLNSPYGVAVDALGNVFIADTENARVVELPAGGGAQVTVPLTESNAPTGIAVDPQGDLYVVYPGDTHVVELPWTGSKWGAQITVPFTGLVNPWAVAADSAGDVFVADLGAADVTEVLADGEQITVSGTSSAASGVALDGSGNLYVVYSNDLTLTRVQLHNVNFGTQVVGSTSAAQTLNFSIASGITLGSIGILTQGAAGLDFAGPAVSTCTAKTYRSPTPCTLHVAIAPKAAGLRSGAVVFFSGPNNTGNVLATVPIFGAGTGPQIVYRQPAPTTVSTGYTVNFGIAVDGKGNLYVADRASCDIYKIAPNGTRTTIGSGYQQLAGLAVDGAGNLYIADSLAKAVYKLTPGGVRTKIDADLSFPVGLAVDGQGNLYVADSATVSKITPAGIQTNLGSGFKNTFGVAVDAAGNVYVSDRALGAVFKIAPDGTQTTAVSDIGGPVGVAVDAAGDLYVVDQGTSAVLQVIPGGLTFVVSGGLDTSSFLALDGGGNLYLSEDGIQSVVRMQSSAPPSLTFKNTSVDSTSTDSPKEVEVVDIGNRTLAFTRVNFPTDFPGEGSSPAVIPEGSIEVHFCAGSESIRAGQFCQLYIEFSPRSGGKLSEDVTLTDNALNVRGATQSIAVQGTAVKLAQTIDFTAPVNGLIGTKVTLSATATSGLPVTFTVTTPAKCSISGSTVTLSAQGNCIVKAAQSGNGAYAAATPVDQTIRVLVE